MAASKAANPVTPKADPMQEKVSVHIPRASGEDQNLVVGLNGKLWIIPRGKTSEVPKPVYDIIKQSERNADIAHGYSDNQQEIAKKVQGAP